MLQGEADHAAVAMAECPGPCWRLQPSSGERGSDSLTPAKTERRLENGVRRICRGVRLMEIYLMKVSLNVY